MIYHIYIYQETINEALFEVFDNLSEDTQISLINNSIIKVSIKFGIEEDLVDYNLIQASLVSDFNLDTKLLYLSDKVLNFIEERVILESLSLLNYYFYDITSFLIELGRDRKKREYLKRQLVELLGQDYIQTIKMIVKCNMNLSTTAKKLFLHRNSLNYRIDKIIEKIDIDVKQFSGLRALINVLGE